MDFEIPKIDNNTINKNINSKEPTLAFITMCKNEAHCIRETLESVYKHIDYWIVCDTGSTDNTCEVVTEFFREKNIPGELFHDEWKDFGHNKTLMFQRVYNKTDYLLHLDADDQLKGDFNKNMLIGNHYDKYNFKYVRSSNEFLTSSLYNNRIRWKYAGVCHNIIICLDKKNITTSNLFVSGNIYVDNELRGARQNDPEKYIKEAVKLQKQFFDTLYIDEDGLNSRSAFYAAQSYKDSGHYQHAINWYSLYTKLKNTWIEEVYIAYVSIAQCLINLKKSHDEVENIIKKATETISDRAEAYYIMGKYLNDNGNTELGYKYLKQAESCNYQEVCKKYILFINKYNYGKYIKDELSVSCYWTDRGDEGYRMLLDIIDDVDFKHHRERLMQNKKHFENKYKFIE